MGNILQRIIETKRMEVAAAEQRMPQARLEGAVRELPQPRDFHGAIAGPALRGVHLIAEIKRKSPSAGLIRPDFDPVELARVYHAHGASALSVLTDETYFDGRLEFIERVKAAVPLPVLRKDFMIDPYQIYESRAAGADAVLLIGEVLPPRHLLELFDLSYKLGMTTLIEVHEAATLNELKSVISLPNSRRSLLGINNRDLKTQRTDLATTAALAGMVGEGTLLVAESGVQTRADVQQLIAAGAHALLIGETFMRAADVGAKIDELFGPI